MRLVFDTATIVAALRSGGGASRQLLVWVFERRYVLFAGGSTVEDKYMTKCMTGTDVVPRLEPSHLVEARRVVEAEGLAVDQLVNEAVAEKLAAPRTRAYFAERSARADVDRALGILARAGHGVPPMSGDELPMPTPVKQGLDTNVDPALDDELESPASMVRDAGEKR